MHPNSKLKFMKIIVLITTKKQLTLKTTWSGVLLMDSELASSNSINSGGIFSGNCIDSSNCTPGAERHFPSDIFHQLFNSNDEESSILLLSVLLMVSGLILFIYGLISGQLYQFIMAFFFLIPGLILDDARQQQLCAR